MNLTKVGTKGTDLIHLAPHRQMWRAFVNTVINLRIPYGGGTFLTR
jgi:hypothetical protein